ncbi:MAG TPA: indole-3-glycerol phosphate synthase TrpC [Candidatus Methylacidiphilales bacterium]|jgi:indole-3-glycerol phosphate synthase|nr:indole-3-glycerol phosphate synthase TrpC [Candidatus Methylacidiphilales bacterium]
MKTRLRIILRDVRSEVEASKISRPISELKDMIKDAAPVRSLSGALRHDFGVMAEVKVKSPSAGFMRPENVRDTTTCYEKSPLVRAVSVLTNGHFGMSIERLAQAKKEFSKPILRKDFIIDEYQIYESRAYGADAILLMGNVLNKSKLQKFWQLAQELGLEVLFESHTRAEIKNIPVGASIYGINCRLMDSSGDAGAPIWEPLLRMLSADTDPSRFNMIRFLPVDAIKVAESGISSSTVKNVKDRGYNAALIGTSLLTAPEGLQAAIGKFEAALAPTGDGKADARTLEHAVA